MSHGAHAVEPAWTCPTCHQPATAQYCAHCGERRLHPHDLTLAGLAHQAVEAVTHADGRIFSTFRALITRPGALTVAYVTGQRSRYLGPIQIFLIVNVLFYLLQSASHMKVFSTPLRSQLNNQFYSIPARRVVEAHLARKGVTVAEYTPVYDRAADTNAKSFVILMVLPLAVVSWALFRRRRPQAAVHLVFALHFYAFWMLAFAPIVLLVNVLELIHLWTPLVGSSSDAVFSLGHLALTAVFLSVAVGRVYGARGWWRLATVIPLAVTVALMTFGYRLAVLFITLYTT